MPAPLLELQGVTKSFGAVKALRGVSFSLYAGEVHALLGENGAGKSTLIKLIAGAHQPDGGRLLMDGTPLEGLTPAMAHALGIACIHQQPALFPDLTVSENIALRLEQPALLKRSKRRHEEARAAEILQQLGARIDPQAQVRDLSMPKQQLVEIACVLGAGVRLVIMDEPTASLTIQEQHLLFSIVRGLRDRGVGVIYISHRLEEIAALADRVTVLRDGESLGTHTAGEVNGGDLIRLMAGRDVSAPLRSAEGEHGAVVLEACGLSCKAAGLAGIDLEIKAGEVLGIAGLVGAGRTELARVLFGITPADGGEIKLKGRRVRIASPQRAIELGIAYVPEDRRQHGVFAGMSVAENISMAVHRRIFPGGWLRPGAERRLALHYLAEFDIKAAGSAAPVSSLSGGNQQKVAVSRWIATRPQVLILDEPTQGVDVAAKAELHRSILRLAAKGMAVLMISSDLTEILGLSDRIAVMRNGAIAGVLHRPTSAADVMALAVGQRSSMAG